MVTGLKLTGLLAAVICQTALADPYYAQRADPPEAYRRIRKNGQHETTCLGTKNDCEAREERRSLQDKLEELRAEKLKEQLDPMGQ